MHAFFCILFAFYFFSLYLFGSHFPEYSFWTCCNIHLFQVSIFMSQETEPDGHNIIFPILKILVSTSILSYEGALKARYEHYIFAQYLHELSYSTWFLKLIIQVFFLVLKWAFSFLNHFLSWFQLSVVGSYRYWSKK